MLIRATADTAAPSVDLTPIIDMVFLLLIFFLVATTFQQTEREVNIALPSASAAVPISAGLRELVINIDAEGRIIVSGKTLEPEALRELVKGLVESNPEQKVSIRADRTTPYANVVRVLDICKGSGVSEPYLDTIEER